MKKLIILLIFIASMAFESVGQVSTQTYSGYFSVDDTILAEVLDVSPDAIDGNGVFGYYDHNGQKVKHGKLILSVPGGKVLGEYSNGSKSGKWMINIENIRYELTFLQDKITGPVKIEYAGNSLSGSMKDNHWIGKVAISEHLSDADLQYDLNFNSNGMADGVWKIIRPDGSYSKLDFADGALLSISEYSAVTGKTDITYTLSNDLKQVIIEGNTSSVFSDAEGTQYRLENIGTSDFSVAGHNIGQPCVSSTFNRMLSLENNCFKKLINLTQLTRDKEMAEQLAEQKRLEAIKREELRQQQIQEEKIAKEEAIRKQQEEQEKRVREEELRKQQEMEAYMAMIKNSEPIPFQQVEEKPSFMGGDSNNFSKWINQNLVYPETAKKNRIQGRVTLSFIVNADGSVSGVMVLRGVEPSLDQEAVRVVSASPKWTPGKIDGKPVRVRYVLPVIFML